MSEASEPKDLAATSYEPVGSCIYCGKETELEDEHIVPLGLGGTAVLPKSSCRGCATITCRFEGVVLRGPMWPVGVWRKLKSRTRHKDFPGELPLTAVRDDAEEEVRVPLKGHPLPLAFPVVDVPGLIKPATNPSDLQLKGIAGIRYGRKPEEVLEALEADDYRLTQRYRLNEFARMIAKIAYSFAVAERFLTLTEGVHPIASAILGKTDDVGAYVGNFRDPVGRRIPRNLHRLELKDDEERGWRFAYVKLFADDPTPEYWVMFDVRS